MQITASMVKELRQRTGAGMMDCKKALQEVHGDMEAAIASMRKSGVAKAAKRAGRIAAEGIIFIKQATDAGKAVIVEINCETDFVAKDENFRNFAYAVTETLLTGEPNSHEELNDLPLAGSDGCGVEEGRLQLVAKLGENIGIRRFKVMQRAGNELGSYVHADRIGVLADIDGGDAGLARDIAMHIAASRPVCISEADMAQEMLDKEKEIYTAQANESGKPPDIIEKMVTGRLKKFINEITLLGQPFVKDPDQSVGELLNSKQARVNSFVRFEVGEGIEKKSENFAREVMAQAGM
ncbi:MAG: translation elongation factor Ts [Gammaproteobacteria bacterium]